MKNIKKEYDAFGPWILEIKSQADVPGHFDSFFKYETDDSLVLKIPKHISRRNANPGDILYKSLIAFNKNHIITLDYKNEKIIKKEMKYTSIKSIQTRTDLLNGNLIVHSKKESIKIPYNAVSENLMSNAIFNLRKNSIAYLSEIETTYQIKKDYSAPINYYFKNILSKLKSKENIFILKTQETKKIGKINKKWYDSSLDIYNTMVLQEIMFLTNNKELIIISRKNAIKRKRTSDYSNIYTYIPLENLIDITYEPHEIYSDVYRMFFKLSEKNYTFYVQEPLSDNIINQLIHSKNNK
jgi:hypothetical protein